MKCSEKMSPEVLTESPERKEDRMPVSWELLIENTLNGADISTMILREGCTQS